jgi:hypothetical protein
MRGVFLHYPFKHVMTFVNKEVIYLRCPFSALGVMQTIIRTRLKIMIR